MFITLGKGLKVRSKSMVINPPPKKNINYLPLIQNVLMFFFLWVVTIQNGNQSGNNQYGIYFNPF